MNSKLIAGISLASIAGAAFWACGEGNINEMTMMDDIVSKQYSTVEELVNLKEDAMRSCKEDMGCYTQYQAYLDGTEEPVIDNPDPIEDPNPGQQNPNPNTGLSSSSRGAFDIVDKPKSSANIIDAPIEQSSSSLQIVDGGTFGTCAPATSPISKGGNVQWKFTPNMDFTGAKMDIMKLANPASASYVWTFAADAIDDGSQTPMVSGKVTYNNSGSTTASVTVTYEGAAYQINCEPLQVNGSAITGCKCAPVGVTGSVNFLETPDITWSVSGCTSAGANVTTYTWNGTPGEATEYTQTFDAAAASYAPTLQVGNDDNTVIDVDCSPVKVTEGAEFTIKTAGDQGAIKLPAGTSLVVLAVDAWSNTFFCKVERSDSPTGALSITVDEESFSGGDYISKALTGTQLKSGKSVSVTLDYPATCGIN